MRAPQRIGRGIAASCSSSRSSGSSSSRARARSDGRGGRPRRPSWPRRQPSRRWSRSRTPSGDRHRGGARRDSTPRSARHRRRGSRSVYVAAGQRVGAGTPLVEFEQAGFDARRPVRPRRRWRRPAGARARAAAGGRGHRAAEGCGAGGGGSRRRRAPTRSTAQRAQQLSVLRSPVSGVVTRMTRGARRAGGCGAGARGGRRPVGVRCRALGRTERCGDGAARRDA